MIKLKKIKFLKNNFVKISTICTNFNLKFILLSITVMPKFYKIILLEHLM